MYIFKKQKDVETFLSTQSSSIGFVPTMGALHPGHISLVEKAKLENVITGCSIFINPTQFNDLADYQKYPVTLENDVRLLIEAQCDFLFLASLEEMYPGGTSVKYEFDLGPLNTVLEGKYRPGHFDGVCYIVDRLLNIISPARLYVGEKDFQQCMVIKKLLALKTSKVQLVTCPTLREENGLAMSSRNMRLDDTQRIIADQLFKSLTYIMENQHEYPFEVLQNRVIKDLEEKGFIPGYISLADADNFELLDDFDRNRNMVVLIAAVLGDVRLIDNLRM